MPKLTATKSETTFTIEINLEDLLIIQQCVSISRQREEEGHEFPHKALRNLEDFLLDIIAGVNSHA